MKPCPICKGEPSVHRHERANEPKWYAIECMAHPMMTVKTQRCGTLEDAERIWDERAE